MLRIRDLETHQKNLLALIEHAKEYGFVDMAGAESDGFVRNFTKAGRGQLPPSDLEAFNAQIRERVLLDVYTTTLAAAWAGVGIDAIRDGVWKQKTLRTWKPGHDVLIKHEDLVAWVDSRN